MSEISSEVKTRQQPKLDSAGARGALAEISPATLASRQRFVRVFFLGMILGGLGLSAIPRPTYGTNVVKTEISDGVTTQIHEFTYQRNFGIPFPTVATQLQDTGGGIEKLSIDGNGFLGIVGNMLVAGALVLGLSVLIRRRRVG